MLLRMVKIKAIALFLIHMAICLKAAPNGKVNTYKNLCGTFTEQVRFPSIVSIIHNGTWCGDGIIINPNWILTSAWSLKMGNDFEIRAGTYKVNSSERWEQITFSAKVVRHPNYDSYVFENDIALVKVWPPFNFTDTVQEAELPSSHFVATGNATVVGRRSNGNPYLLGLPQQNISILPSIECAAAYGSVFHLQKMMCGRPVNLDTAPCTTWSLSSPLFCLDHRFNQSLLCGIASFAVPTEPTVFTKVSYYISWIRSIVDGTDQDNSLSTMLNISSSSPQKCGREAVRNEFPFIVSIFRDKKHICEGSVINSSWVITAASCVEKSGFGIIVGAHDLSKEEDNVQVAIPIKVVKHPEYDRETFENDIALVKIFPTFFGIEPITIPRHGYKVTKEAVAAGWGIYKSEHASFERTLQTQIVQIQDKEHCSMYGTNFRFWKHICGDDGFGKGACVGHAGSPLVCSEERTRKNVLCGIADFKIFGSPSVYLKTSYFSDWIRFEMEKTKSVSVQVSKVQATYVKKETVVVKDEETGGSYTYVKITVIVVVVVVVVVAGGAGFCGDD